MTPSTSAPAGPSTRQKRILPSRSRRGGPGVGSCEVDVMILDTMKRKFENEPLIPAETHFLLTTQGSMAGSAVSSTSAAVQLNVHARGRYFERPEVIKAYKEQLVIQTPDFIPLSEAARVGSRFRPRGLDDEIADTSDLAYEKRHRKYETFEKRQRLREKEKLKHEQYKLKERIDQLRAMDGAAFMTLPSSAFSSTEDAMINDVDNVEDGDLSDPNNNVPIHNEGERRRKDMLDVAYALEERYRVLLPPDRVKKFGVRNGINASVEPEWEVPAKKRQNQRKAQEYEEPEVNSEDEVAASPKQTEKIKLKIKFPAGLSLPLPAVSVKPESPTKRRKSSTSSPTTKYTREPRVARTSSKPTPSDDVAGSPQRHSDDEATSTSQLAPSPLALAQGATSAPDTPVPTPGSPNLDFPEIAVLQDQESPPPEKHIIDLTDSLPRGRPRKRRKKSIALSNGQLGPDESDDPSYDTLVPPIESISMQRSVSSQPSYHKGHGTQSEKSDKKKSALLIAAMRSSNSRKTQRHVTAFGIKIPPIVEEFMEFEIPVYLDVDALVEERITAAELREQSAFGEQEVDITAPSAPPIIVLQPQASQDTVDDGS